MNTFETLGIEMPFIEKLKERSIVKPTAIQDIVIPRLFAGKDTVFRSATGTGKTFAYLLPVLQQIAKTRGQGLAALICAPTLELCSQIKAEVDFLTDLPTSLLIGSVQLDKQIENLKKERPVIAVGNPGRLLVLAKMGKLKLQNLHFLILDEADRLTANELFDDTKEFLSRINRGQGRNVGNSGIDNEEPPRTGLCVAACSATVGGKTRALLGPLFENAEIAESDDHEILRERIEHWAFFSEKRRRVQTLRSLLAALRGKKSKFRALVFTSRGDDAGRILSQLQYHHMAATGLFSKAGGKPLASGDRKAALDAFRSGKADVLVSTDLAARGLDIPNLGCVIALDVPEDKEVYIHRAGRTARAGKRGIMATIGDETQMRLLASLEKKLKIRVQPKELYMGRVCVPEI